ncbi:piggyBac transposable element-derived protein 4-like [Saccostrea cucullata]|uniref:piggyBac transposable element-derived protein 4-like n=1 Tax=Saccostrea cuccullata TaxID=36930 RepID=UPI002ED34B02
MADLPTNEEILRDYFDSDDDLDEFEGFSDADSDIYIPEESSSEEESESSSESEPENDDEWTENLRGVRVDPFVEGVGPVFPDNFDVNTATAKDYFDLMFSPDSISDFVRHTNNYARWKMEQKGEEDRVWYEITEAEMKAYLGLNILMGINQLPSYKDYWSKDVYLGNEGVKSVMTSRRYEKITEYFHVSDRASEPARGTRNFDKLFKVREVLTMTKRKFNESYKPNKSMAIDEAMIKWTGRLSYKQYLPAKPIKRGIKVWMRCDSENAFLTDFNIYLGKGEATSEHGLGHDVVTKLSRDITGKNHHLYFDNYFTSVKLMEDLLEENIYACGTVRMNRRGFPDDLKGRLRLQRGQSQTRQKGNLTASVWQDKKPVAFLSTLSDPRRQVPVTRQHGRQELQMTQPHAANEYNKYMNGVDRHDQLRLKYPLGRDSKKAWKYIFYFLMNCAVVNSFILFCETSNRPNTRKRFTHVAFRMELVHHLIAGFSGRKRKAAENVEVVHQAENFPGHESVHMGTKRRCRVHMNKKERKETVYGCKVCNVHLCKDGCHFTFHGGQ